MHAGVAAVLWSIRAHPAAGRTGHTTADDRAEVEVHLASWEPVSDGPSETEAIAEQLPAQASESAVELPQTLAPLAEPVKLAAAHVSPPALLPANEASGRAREKYRRLLREGARTARAIVDAVARLGERSARDVGETGAGARAEASAAPARPTRGPRATHGNRPPHYPEELRRARREGTAWIHAVIEADGTVSSAFVARSAGTAALDESALGAVRSWRFEPALEDGVAVRSEADLPVVFRIRARTID